MQEIRLSVNGKEHQVDVDRDTPLLWVLREALGLTGTKFGCGRALCGACTVHLDGEAVASCVTAVSQVGNAKVTTIEGLATPAGVALRKAWIEEDVPQCGYCQSGQIMTAAALLAGNTDPTPVEVARGMAGTLCRCGTYQRIHRAIDRAAAALTGRGEK